MLLVSTQVEAYSMFLYLESVFEHDLTQGTVAEGALQLATLALELDLVLALLLSCYCLEQVGQFRLVFWGVIQRPLLIGYFA